MFTNPLIIVRRLLVAAAFATSLVCGTESLLAAESTSPSEQANQTEIRGRVLDQSGLPVIGAAVFVSGSMTGTTTDADGTFSLRCPAGATLLVSSLGYREKTALAVAGQVMEIILEEDSELLDATVVTALGIKREEKALGYAVQKVDGSAVQKVGTLDVGTALAGKVSGMLVRTSSDFNSQPSVLIRGEAPLLVVDGVAYANKTLSDIASEDIASISVLKGATASALYGYRGANGALIVTTKNGSEGGTGITVDASTNTMFTAGYLAIPEKQTTYGRGTSNIYDKNATNAWGTVMDGTVRNQWDPVAMEYRDYEYLPVGKDNFKNFLETGYITNNNVNVAFKTRELALRSSLNWTGNKSRYPNHRVDKFSYTLGGEVNLDRFHFASNITYSKRFSPNSGLNGYTGYDPMYNLLLWSSADFNIMDYKDNYWMVPGEVQNYTLRSGHDSVWFDMYEKINEKSRDLFNADFSTSYDIAPWLKATLRAGLDFFVDSGKMKISKGANVGTGNNGIPGGGTWLGANKTGAYATGRNQGWSLNTDFLLSGNQSFLGEFEADYLLGGTVYYDTANQLYGQTNGGISVPGFFSLNASVNSPSVKETMLREMQVNSVFGRLALSWRKMLFVEATARNDWSSTLAGPGIDKSSMSYFYPSVSGSFVISELLPEQTRTWLDLLKLRGSWTVSKTPPAVYSINQAFSTSANVWNTLSGATAPHTLEASNLSPSAARTYEAGLQAIFFKNRLSLDVSYYDKEMYNELKNGPVTPASGVNAQKINSLERIARRGWEISLGGTPVLTRDWEWNVAANWSTYKRVYTALDETYSSKKPWVQVGNRVDAYVIKEWLRVPETGELITNNGRLVKSNYDSVVGYADPHGMWGLSTTLRWKNLSLYAALDGVIGGLGYSMTEIYLWRSGNHPDSVTPERALDVATPGSKNFLLGGVKVIGGEVTYDTDGNITSDTRKYAPNDIYTTYKDYVLDSHANLAWGGAATEPDVYSLSYFKLREISLTYQFPKKAFDNVRFLKGASVSAVGQNVLLFAKDFRFSDPDGGTEDLADPAVRYLGFNVKLTF